MGMADLFDAAWTDTIAYRQARAICHDCPIIAACAATARHRREWGVWGGQRLRKGRPAHRNSDRTKLPGVDDHSMTGYRKGCRCDDCRAAKRAARRRETRNQAQVTA